MSPPVVPFSTWIWAGFDPLLIAIAVFLGWKADQAAKIVVAALAALGAALLFDSLVTAAHIPWIAPLSREGPMLLPVRSAAALIWSAAGFGARMIRDRTR